MKRKPIPKDLDMIKDAVDSDTLAWKLFVKTSANGIRARVNSRSGKTEQNKSRTDSWLTYIVTAAYRRFDEFLSI